MIGVPAIAHIVHAAAVAHERAGCINAMVDWATSVDRLLRLHVCILVGGHIQFVCADARQLEAILRERPGILLLAPGGALRRCRPLLEVIDPAAYAEIRAAGLRDGARSA